ncbi:MAG: glycosyltransferase family 2 protein [Burkholderiales bacterium]
MTVPPCSHLILIPSYNTGPKVLDTVREARRYWSPVWVVIDGSTDGTAGALQALAVADPALQVLVLPHNQGKGAAVLHGLRAAAAAGYTHVLTMDADGQHPATKVPEFIETSRLHPQAVILGQPVFDASAPAARVYGRKLSNGLANLQTLWLGIGDALYGFRVYPIAPLRAIMESHRWMRHFDFEPEAAVRLCWRGVEPINLAAPVKYFTAEEGGVSHFNYLRDNALLTWMNLRLLLEFVLRLPWLLVRRFVRSSRR